MSAPNRRELREWLMTRLAELLELRAEEIDPDEPLASYGLSSMDAASLSGELATFAGLRLPPTLFYDEPTVARVLDHVSGAASAAPAPRPTGNADDTANGGADSASSVADAADPASTNGTAAATVVPPAAERPTAPTLAPSAAAAAVARAASISPASEEAASTTSAPSAPLYADEPIAIVGMACRFPGAPDLQALWRLLAEGRFAVTDVPASRWDASAYYDPDPAAPGKATVRTGGFLDAVDQFDHRAFSLSPREAAHMDPQQRLLLELTWLALEDAHAPFEPLRGSRTGVFVGIGGSDFGRLLRDAGLLEAYAGTGAASSIAANRLSYFFDLRGPSVAIDTACSSALTAVHLACQSLRAGDSRLALAAAVNLMLTPESTIIFSKAGMLAPDGRCKVFDARANGYVRSEGAGVVVLKPLRDAQAAGDRIYAVIRGTAVNQDGRTNGLTAPSRQAQESLLRDAYARAGVSPGRVAYVEAHGAGTELGDPIEAGALHAVLQEGRAADRRCPIGSIKTNIGHTETAAGMAGLMKTVLALHHRQIPPSLHFQTANPHIDFDRTVLRVPTMLEPWPADETEPAIAGVSAFGFGGANAHVVLEAAPRPAGSRVDLTDAGDAAAAMAATTVTVATTSVVAPSETSDSSALSGLSSPSNPSSSSNLSSPSNSTNPSTPSDAQAAAAQLPASAASRDWSLLCLSARTPGALDAGAAALADLLGAPGAPALADLSHALHAGRTRHEHRRFIVSRTSDEARAALAATDMAQPSAGSDSVGSPSAGSGARASNARFDRTTVFLFPGLGDQHAAMAEGLYGSEAHVRQEIDRCAEILRPMLGVDLRDLLYGARGGARPSARRGGLRELVRRATLPDAASDLARTELAHPAVFTVEYALATLLGRWGIRPDAMLGFSLGEYVAATLAGVFSLEAALAIVAGRARILSALPPGGMLAVALGADRTAPLLGPGQSVAVDLTPSACVVAGSHEALAALAQTLTDRGITHRPLAVTQAFHSPALDPAIDAIAALVATHSPRPPAIPYISNLTGDWITDADATDPRYYGLHACRPVRLEAGIRRLLDAQPRRLLEVGPGQALGSFFQQHPSFTATGPHVCLATLPHALDEREDVPFLLNTVGRLWTDGVAIDWRAFHGDEPRPRVSLPSYAFERERHWPAIPTSSAVAAAVPARTTGVPAVTTIAAPPAAPLAAAVAAPLTSAVGGVGAGAIASAAAGAEIAPRLEMRQETSDVPAASAAAPRDPSGWLYAPVWKPAPDRAVAAFPLEQSGGAGSDSHAETPVDPRIESRVALRVETPSREGALARDIVLLIDTGTACAARLAAKLRHAGARVLTASPASAARACQRTGDDYELDASDDAQWRALMEGVAAMSAAAASEAAETVDAVDAADTTSARAANTANAANTATAAHGAGAVHAAATTAAGPRVRVVYLRTLSAPRAHDAATFRAAQQDGLYGLLAVARAMHGADWGTGGASLLVATVDACRVDPADMVRPEQAALQGACRVIRQEMMALGCRQIDVTFGGTDAHTAASAGTGASAGAHADARADAIVTASAVARADATANTNVPANTTANAAAAAIDQVSDALLAELTRAAEDDEPLVAYRGGRAFLPHVARMAPPPLPIDAPPALLRARGAYLITGGTGGIGLLLAEYLARTVQARLVLTCRSPFPPRAEWNGWMAAHPGDARTGAMARLIACEALGAEIHVESADAADEPSMRAIVARARDRWGRIDGVVHGAGVVSADAFSGIETLTSAECERHFQPKVDGLYALRAALAGGDAPDIVILLSSLSSLLGGIGFAAYAAANASLDAFAHAQTARHAGATRWISVNLEYWLTGSGRESTVRLGPTVARHAMRADEGVAAFRYLFDGHVGAQVALSTSDLAARIDEWVRLKTLRPPAAAAATRGVSSALDTPTSAPASAASTASAPSSAASSTPAIAPAQTQAAAPFDEVEAAVGEVWRAMLGMTHVSPHDNFFDLGGNSLIGVQVVAQLNQRLGVRLATVALFEAPTIARMSAYIAARRTSSASAAPRAGAPAPDAASTVAPGTAPASSSTVAPALPDASDAIAIIGMAGRFPGAPSVAALWDNLLRGLETVSFFTDAELLAAGVPAELISAPNYVKARPVVARAGEFDAHFFGYSPREADVTDPQQRLFLECAHEALERAGCDPERHAGAIGVFGGTNISSYWLQRRHDPALASALNIYQVAAGNDKDSLATTVSYRLNLRGPSITVQTHCSTSLVAVHLACQSLRTGESDLALAGGAAIRAPQVSGYLFEPGSQESPDGHTRSFDRRAKGTVFGDGVGIVVLKRLADAVREGDLIHAVIKSSAINNDGALKAGFTAPSVVGQAHAVAMALGKSRVPVESIGLVEAHGSATELGDPIEVAALNQAFRARTDKRHYCALGSVKSNVGHLDKAAGVTGLIKAVLAVERGVIPPSLHFEEPNPEIDFADSPFYVNTETRAWPADLLPRRAAVNSLGMGGTNAHVVLEEAPPRTASSASRGWQVLLVSAKTMPARDAACAQLAAHLESSMAAAAAARESGAPDATPAADDAAAFADVAYTLQIGRRELSQRAAVICRDAADAASVLASGDPVRMLTASTETRDRAVSFLFPGVGDHYAAMAAGLYRTERVFRDAVDRCATAAAPHLDGADLRTAIWPDGVEAAPQGPGLDLRRLVRGDSAVGALDTPALAQTAVFTIGYALAALLEAWGVRPQAVLGYSLGEYTAACVAGVFTVEDTVALVARRAALIAAQPPGAMLAVSLGEAALTPWLAARSGLSIAIVNGPSVCIVSGTIDAVTALEAALGEAKVISRRVQTTHALHSPHMAGAAAALAQLIADVPRQAPVRPVLSNVTGTWLTAEQATSPDYWARHLCEPVRFDRALQTLLDHSGAVLVELGPGQTLGSLVKQIPAGAARAVVPLLRSRYETQDDQALALSGLAKLWLAGVTIDWHGVARDETRHRVLLPTYPFERQRHWIEPRAVAASASASTDASGAAQSWRLASSDWLHQVAWTARPLAPAADDSTAPSPATASDTATEAGSDVLIFLDERGIGEALARRLSAGSAGHRVATVSMGPRFAALGEGRFAVDPERGADYADLLRALGSRPRTIVYLAAIVPAVDAAIDRTIVPAIDLVVDPARGAGNAAAAAAAGTSNHTPASPRRLTTAACAESQSRGFHALVRLVQALGVGAGDRQTALLIVTANARQVADEAIQHPEQATLLGLCRTVPNEYAHLTCRAVDLDLAAVRLPIVAAAHDRQQRDERHVSHDHGINGTSRLNGARFKSTVDSYSNSSSNDNSVIDSDSDSETIDRIAAHLASEIADAAPPLVSPALASAASPPALDVAYRRGVRYVAGVERVSPLPAGAAVDAPALTLRDRGVYVITGGFGGIGLAVAERLARRYRARLVLAGRTALPDADAQAALLAAPDTPDAIVSRIRAVRALERLGAEVLAVAADVADPAQAEALIQAARARFGRVDGLFHAAGVPGMGLIQLKTRDLAESVLAPKVRGTVALANALHGDPPDFLVLFSSIASIVGGGPGQVDYCAANAFLNAYAAHLTAQGLPAIALAWCEWQWDAWQDGLTAFNPELREFFRANRRTYGLTFDEGFDVIERALAMRRAEIVVSTRSVAAVAMEAASLTTASILQRFAPEAPAAHSRPSMTTAYVPALDDLEKTIAAAWQRVLGVDRVGIHDNFFDLGGNSLIGLQIVADLAKALAREVSPVALYEAPTVQAMARLLNPAASEAGDGTVAAAPLLAPRARRRHNPSPIAIVGMAGRFPGARDVSALWRNLVDGVESITFFSDEELAAAGVDPALIADPNYVKAGSVIDDIDCFDAGLFGYSPREAEVMDPQHRLFLECAWAALEDAGCDPDRYPGAIGVFGGANISTYLLRLHPDQETFEPYNLMGIGVGYNSSDSLTTKVSYKLNLSGPSVALQTFCSTSGVAIHMACRTLRDGECDMALAGGVRVAVPHRAGYRWMPGSIDSPDGHCRAFDAKGQGVVLGNGVAIVALKRLDDALADGDHIYAVIKGSASNNDGAMKAGYTAPSVDRQAQVVLSALADAEVTPDAVRYVEAHGTGTELGDPIEMTALSRAFRTGTPERQYCAIGSVKTNVGHLDRAAGATSIIKTALALDRELIPASLYFDEPNPQIDFANSPFYVNTALTPWPRQPEAPPRTAGVHVVGIGGTNIHFVMQEAPPQAPGSASRDWQVLLVSAKTAAARTEACTRLAAHLETLPSAPPDEMSPHARANAHADARVQAVPAASADASAGAPADDAVTLADVALADVAYTLQTGRRELPQRAAVICRGAADAAAVLASGDPTRLLIGAADTRDRAVSFLFPGVGDHYTAMAAGLYRTERIFRDAVDRCADAAAPHLGGVNLRTAIWPDGVEAAPKGPGLDLRRLVRGESAVGALDTPVLAQTAVFTIGYALAALLEAWGVRPQVVLGYSLGEYTAACVAGVFAVEDAVALVARRAALIAAQPPGAMLAVSLSEAALAPWLTGRGGLSIAIVNGASVCVVSGTIDAVAALEAALGEAKVINRRVQTTHALHSPHMAGAAAALARLIAEVPRQAPARPIVSNLTGTWLTAEEATSPDYWARHLCEPVRFDRALQTLLDHSGALLAELGPGQTLGSLVRQAPAGAARAVVSLLRSRYETQDDQAWALGGLAKLWLGGAAIDWRGFAQDETRRRVSLPAYPFERQRYWIEPRALAAGTTALQPKEALGRIERITDWFYVPVWKQSVPLPPAVKSESARWIVFSDTGSVARTVIDGLRARGEQVLAVQAGTRFSASGDGSVTIDPASRADYARLLKEADASALEIVHTWTLADAASAAADTADTRHTELARTDPARPNPARLDPACPDPRDTARATRRRGLYPLMYLAQALGDIGARAHITVATAGLQQVTGEETFRPDQALLIGACKVIPQEYADIRCSLVDLPAGAALSEPSGAFASGAESAPTPAPALAAAPIAGAQLLAEVLRADAAPSVAYRGTQRWLETYEPLPLEAIGGAPGRLRERGVYAITGGAGGIGLALAKHLARTVKARVVLIGRTPLPPREAWDALIAQDDATVARKLREIREIEALGGEVMLAAADVADAEAMAAVFDRAEARFGALHGVIHAAGVPGAGLIQLKTPDAVEGVLRPKVDGTLAIARALDTRAPLDFMVLFSSLTSIVGGGPGQFEYCAANAFLDAFARAEQARGRTVIAIDWGEWKWDAWQSGLLGFDQSIQAFFRENRETYGVTFEEGMEAFDRSVHAGVPQVIVSTRQFRTFARLSTDFTLSAIMQATAQSGGPALHERPVLGTSYVEPSNDRERQIAEIWRDVLRIEQIGLHDNFFELGGNSLVGIDLIARLRARLGAELPMYALYEAPSVGAMAAFLESSGDAEDAEQDSRLRGGRRRARQRRRGTRDEPAVAAGQ